MHTLVVGNQKGGVGKTAIVNQLAFYLNIFKAENVLVIDADPQANTSYTLTRAEFPSRVKTCAASSLFTTPNIDPDSFPDNGSLQFIAADPNLSLVDEQDKKKTIATFHGNLAAIRDSERFATCIIDTGPSIGRIMTAVLIAADFVLSPIKLDTYSITGIKTFLTAITNARKLNPSLQFLGMLPNCVDRREPYAQEDLDRLRAAHATLVLPHEIGQRSSIKVACSDGLPIWQVKKTAARKATEEMRTAFEYIYQAMHRAD